MTNNSQRSLESVYTFLAQYKRHEVPAVGQGGPYRVFVPEGEHIIRLLFDPEAQLWRTVTLHQTKQYRTYCPDLVRDSDPSGVYPLCKICTVATERGDWRLQRAEYVLMYGHLCTTSNASDFWKPGKSYLMIERTRIISPLTQLLGREAVQQPEQLLAMLNPLMPGPAMVVQVTKWLNGSVKIPALTAQCFPSVALGEWFIPLEHCWIGPEFNLADYHAMLAAVTGAQSTSS